MLEILYLEEIPLQKETQDLKEGLNWIQTVLSSAKNLLRLDYMRIIPHGSDKNMLEIIPRQYIRK